VRYAGRGVVLLGLVYAGERTYVETRTDGVVARVVRVACGDLIWGGRGAWLVFGSGCLMVHLGGNGIWLSQDG
jgi:hypothetical protein